MAHENRAAEVGVGVEPVASKTRHLRGFGVWVVGGGGAFDMHL
jgi:hypothetical protein